VERHPTLQVKGKFVVGGGGGIRIQGFGELDERALISAGGDGILQMEDAEKKPNSKRLRAVRKRASRSRRKQNDRGGLLIGLR